MPISACDPRSARAAWTARSSSSIVGASLPTSVPSVATSAASFAERDDGSVRPSQNSRSKAAPIPSTVTSPVSMVEGGGVGRSNRSRMLRRTSASAPSSARAGIARSAGSAAGMSPASTSPQASSSARSPSGVVTPPSSQVGLEPAADARDGEQRDREQRDATDDEPEAERRVLVQRHDHVHAEEPRDHRARQQEHRRERQHL